MAKLIAVTGGIGSGKSVICRILRTCGFLIYDSDSRAKELMDRSPEIWEALCREIHPLAVKDGKIDRRLVSQIVFSDAEKLGRLNRIVHESVAEDLMHWKNEHEELPVLFVETAILYQSHLNRLVDEDWQVTAPEEIRIERVAKRNHITPKEVKARIKAQQYTIPTTEPRPHTVTILNDNLTPVLPQIEVQLSI